MRSMLPPGRAQASLTPLSASSVSYALLRRASVARAEDGSAANDTADPANWGSGRPPSTQTCLNRVRPSIAGDGVAVCAAIIAKIAKIILEPQDFGNRNGRMA